MTRMSVKETVSLEHTETDKQESVESSNYFYLNSGKIKKTDPLETNSQPDSVFRNPNSIESFTAPSPAGSYNDQYDTNTPATTPLSVDDSSDTNNQESNSSSQASFQVNKLSQAFDNPNFRFRRHSSQSSLNLPLNLQINNNNSSATNLVVSPLTLTGSFSNLSSSSNPERVCSSPISSLKMSSRVCQIKIDEGIEPHLSREIKSERETQNTLKLKSSCDELVINSDEHGLESFGFDREQNRTNSPNFFGSSGSSSTFKRYRTFSESQNQNQNGQANIQGNMPSPSVSSFQSYSNSSSPTGFIMNNNNQQSNSNPGLLRCFSPSTTLTSQNYFSQSPSPTRKLFVTRRSMSPVPCNLRPSSLNPNGTLNNKRKISDVDQTDSNGPASFHSPKRSLVDQEFVQPLLILTSNNSNASKVLNRSTTSSPSPSLFVQNQHSPSPVQSLSDKNNLRNQNLDEVSNKYTFIPIQLPQACSSSSSPSLTQPSNSKKTNNVMPNFSCDSPLNFSPSVSSNVSTLKSGDKPDSGYQSSAQNNSDSESCI